MKLNIKNFFKWVLYSFVLIVITFVFTVNCYNVSNSNLTGSKTKTNFNESFFSFGGKRYTNVTIHNYNVTPDGTLYTTLSAQDAVTSDTVKFSSQATIEPAEWGSGDWGKDGWGNAGGEAVDLKAHEKDAGGTGR